MRNIVLPLGALILVGAVCTGLIVSLGTEDKNDLPMVSRAGETWPPSYPALRSDGIWLKVHGVEALSVGKKDLEGLGISKFKIDGGEGKDTFSFVLNGNLIEHSASGIQDVVWSQVQESFFFIQAGWTEKKEDSQSIRIWRWDKKRGFRPISKVHGAMSDLTVSLDGEVVMARAEGEEYMGMAMSEDYLVVSAKGVREKIVTYNDQSTGAVPLSMDEALIDGHNTYGNQTYRWNLADGSVKPLMRDASLVSVAVAGGKLFGVHKKQKGFEIVELNDKMDGWLASFTLPKGVTGTSAKA